MLEEGDYSIGARGASVLLQGVRLMVVSLLVCWVSAFSYSFRLPRDSPTPTSYSRILLPQPQPYRLPCRHFR